VPFSIFRHGRDELTPQAVKDKREYEKFFEMWKDADKDIPALIAAKQEYAELD